MTQATFSIIIPVKPGGAVRALEALRRVDYPAEDFEVLVAEGRCPSLQRNLAAGEAKGEYLYFLDDDSLVAPDFLRRAAACYEKRYIVAVGGPSLTPEDDSPPAAGIRAGPGVSIRRWCGPEPVPALRRASRDRRP